MIKMKVFSPQGTLFDGTVAHATFPGEAGSFAVYPMHAPIVAALRHGNIICYLTNKETGEDMCEIPIQSGFVEVVSDNITVCVEQSFNNQAHG